VLRRDAPAHRHALLTDTAVARHHLARACDAFAAADLAPPLVVEIPPGEAHKTRERWAAVTDRLLEAGCGRDTTLVALGGGVVGDLGGFVAATYLRGIPIVQCPTTLLAMVDASVGGKTAVDTPAGKNLVGAFHPPRAVLIDPSVLDTLPLAELRAGTAEVVKHGVIADAAYLAAVESRLPGLLLPDRAGGQSPAAPASERAQLLGQLVARSVAIKAAVVAQDEQEGGMRRILNFGHTLGHALEQVSGYALRHGEAVAAGMALEARLAELAGVAEAGTADRVVAVLRQLDLPIGRPAGLDPEQVLAATRADKKARAGTVEYALPTRIGAMGEFGGRWSVPVADALVREVLAPAVTA
jgi:3-dehydroquinate synthase